jgi:hypothetical protein
MEDAHATLERQLNEARASQSLTAQRLDEAVRDVIRAEPALKQLINDYETAIKTVVDLRRALDYLASQIALPKERECRVIPYSLACNTRPDDYYDFSDLHADQPWQAFVNALASDPDAEF